MSDAYTGGCACGALRYEIRAEPSVMIECQRQSGTGHSSYLTFKAEAAVTGNATEWHQTGDGGTRKAPAFCPTCGSPVYLTFPDVPGIIAVRAGSLDDPSRYKPRMVSWASAGHAWDHLDPDIPKFDKLPPP